MNYRLKQKRFTENYTKVYHRMINDPRLSLAAKGLHVYLQSKPDNWQFYHQKIGQELRVHRTTVGKLFNDLIAMGYVERVEVDEKFLRFQRKGQFPGYVYNIFPIPKKEFLDYLEQGIRDRVTNIDTV